MTPSPEHERLSAYLDDALPAAERDEFERLLASRPDLETLADEWRHLGVAFRALPARTLSPAFNERVLAAAEQRMLRGPAESVMPATSRMRHYVWAGLAVAVAAVLLVILSIPREERRVARQTRPNDQPPADRPTPETIVTRNAKDIPAVSAPITEVGSEAPPAAADADRQPMMAAYSGMAGRDAPAIPRYDFTVVISPENASQVGELHKILPRPVLDATFGDDERMSDFRPKADRAERARQVNETPEQHMAGTALTTPATRMNHPVDLYVATGAASAIQSLLRELQSAGIPAEMQQRLDPSLLPSAPIEAGRAAPSARRTTENSVVADEMDLPLAERRQETAGQMAKATDATRLGVQLQYLGQVAVAPPPEMNPTSRGGGRELAIRSDTAADIPSQQVLIIIQNPIPSE